MAETFFKAKIGEKTYELSRVTLGQAQLMARHFGLTDLSEFNPANPLHLAGCLYCCLQVENPKTPHALLMQQIDSIDLADFEDVTEDEGEPDPTPSADEAEVEPPAGD